MSQETNFIRNMRRLRELAGLNQTDLANALKDKGITTFWQQTIQRIENGQRPVRLNEAHAIAEVLGKSVEEMVQPATYTVEIHHDPRYGYEAAVLNLPGCFAAGESLDEVFASLSESIGLYLTDGSGESDA
jgi:predicted RNase H-like HicB family nuclease